MKTFPSKRCEAAGARPGARRDAATKQRILESARWLFGERGFCGTHLRDICKRAEVNVAAVCYHFHSKEQLYQMVVEAACRQLASGSQPEAGAAAPAPPEQRLQWSIELLFEKLTGDQLWIAKLLAREWCEPSPGFRGSVRAGLEPELKVLEGVIRQLPGSDGRAEATRLRALSVASLCVFYSLFEAEQALQGHPLRLAELVELKRHVVDFSLAALQGERASR